MKQPVERRLAAILAADVAGYSRLMGADEEGTHERFKLHCRQLVEPKIKEHRGRIVKNTGGGMLVEFPSVVDAVRCAAEVQRGMVDRNANMEPDQCIRFRIGVNLGDVIIDGDDIYGDGVNIAARLEALAEPGGICVSRVVRDQIRDKLLYPFDDMGEQSVKNIARPLGAYAMNAAAVGATPLVTAPTEPSPPRSPQPAAHRHRCGRPCRDRHRGGRLVAEPGFDASLDTSACSSQPANASHCQHADAAPVNRCAAVRQSQQPSRPGIFRRRDHRRSDHRPLADCRQLCNRPHHRLCVQGEICRSEADRP
jgi:class 3 adenylate cyclase